MPKLIKGIMKKILVGHGYANTGLTEKYLRLKCKISCEDCFVYFRRKSNLCLCTQTQKCPTVKDLAELIIREIKKIKED